MCQHFYYSTTPQIVSDDDVCNGCHPTVATYQRSYDRYVATSVEDRDSLSFGYCTGNEHPAQKPHESTAGQGFVSG